MSLRHQLPTYSPLTLGAVCSAGRAALTGADRDSVRLERLLSDEYEPALLVRTDSGTSALALALRIAAAGGRAAVPAFGCYDLATAVEAAGVQAVLYDVDPLTLAPDEASLQAVLASGVATLLVAPLYGVPIAMDRLLGLAAAAQVTIIEDAAQSIGVRHEDRSAGRFGDFGVLSFGRGKGTTGGTGGALLVNSTRAAGRVGQLNLEPAGPAGREVLALSAQWLLGRPSIYGLPSSIPALRLGETIYHPPHPPRQQSAPSVAAVVKTWPLAPAETATRARNAARLTDRLMAAGGWTLFPGVAGWRPGYLRLAVLPPAPRATLLAGRVSSRLGIQPSYPLSLADLPGFRERAVQVGNFPGARRLAAELITLPTHSRLSGRDLAALEAWIDQAGRSAA